MCCSAPSLGRPGDAAQWTRLTSCSEAQRCAVPSPRSRRSSSRYSSQSCFSALVRVMCSWYSFRKTRRTRRQQEDGAQRILAQLGDDVLHKKKWTRKLRVSLHNAFHNHLAREEETDPRQTQSHRLVAPAPSIKCPRSTRHRSRRHFLRRRHPRPLRRPPLARSCRTSYRPGRRITRLTDALLYPSLLAECWRLFCSLACAP